MEVSITEQQTEKTVEKPTNEYFEKYEDNTLELTKQIDHSTLRILLNELISNFDKVRIPYWIDHGTLLGCLRNGRFIPWDDDADISTLQSNYHRVKSLMQTLCKGNKKRYFTKVGNHFCYYFSHESNTHIDIFFYRPIANAPHVYELIHNIPWHLWDEDIIYGLPTREFEGLTVKIPKRADVQMQRHYGVGWKMVAHKYQSGKEKEYYSKSHTDEYAQILDWKLLWEDDRQDKIDNYYEKFPDEKPKEIKTTVNAISELPEKTTVEDKIKKQKERERKKREAREAREARRKK